MKLGLGLSLTGMQRRRDTPAFDPDAAAFIAAREAADGAALEPGVKAAYNDFVVGLKNDSLFSRLVSCGIIAGAHTVNGAIVTLIGPSATNVNLVNADLNRQSGLKGNGATKGLLTNVMQNSVPWLDVSFAAYVTDTGTGTTGNVAIGGCLQNPADALVLEKSGTAGRGRSRLRTAALSGIPSTAAIDAPFFFGVSRSLAASYQELYGPHARTDNSEADDDPGAGNYNGIGVLARADRDNTLASFDFDGRLAFWAYGQSLSLPLLRDRVETLMTAIEDALT